MGEQQYCLRWNNHQINNVTVFSTLLYNELLVDVTLIAEGAEIHAHKLILAACSTYFQRIFIKNPCQHPIIILKDVEAEHLRIIIDFVYHGEVNCTQDQLAEVLRIADMLNIKGLTEVSLRKHGEKLLQVEGPKLEDAGEDKPNVRQTSEPSIRPGPKSQQKTATFQATHICSQHEHCGESKEIAAPKSEYSNGDEQENSNDSVDAQPESPDEPDYSAEVEEATVLVTTEVEMDTNEIENFMENNESNVPMVEEECEQSLDCSASEDGRAITLDSSSTSSSSSDNSEHDNGMLQIDDPHNDESAQNGFPEPTIAHLMTDNVSVADGMQPTVSLNYIETNLLAQSSPQSGSVKHVDFVLPEVYLTGETEKAVDQPPITLKITRGRRTTATRKVGKERRGRPKTNGPEMEQAIEAVRKGMGFCRAARTYGINNRTLWLEYQKRGYVSDRARLKGLKPVPAQE